jgi:hypothetical protein
VRDLDLSVGRGDGQPQAVAARGGVVAADARVPDDPVAAADGGGTDALDQATAAQNS